MTDLHEGSTTMHDVRAATAVALAGGDGSRWPDKLTVGDRITTLLDPGSWVEDGLLANAGVEGMPADGVRTGVGRVEGRPVVVIAHDYTVKAGSWGELTCEKQIRILERADRDLLPVIYLVDSAGGRLSDQMGFFPGRRGASRTFSCRWRCRVGCRNSVACTGHRPRAAPTCPPSATGSAWWRATPPCTSPRRGWPRR